MPVLAAYVGAHDVTGLIYTSAQNYSFWSYPYVYSPELFSALTTETAFYKLVFEHVCKDKNIKLTDCEVILSGFLEPPQIDLGVKMGVSVHELLGSVKEYYPVLINNYAVLTMDQMFSSKPLQATTHENSDNPAPNTNEEDFYANLAIYPQVVVTDKATRLEMDSKLLQLVSDFKLPDERMPLAFLGCRFNKLHAIEDVNTMLILQLLQGLGIFEVFVDDANAILLEALLRMYLGKDPELDVMPQKLLTLISTPNTLECLVTSQIGTSQIIDLEKDNVFALPVASDGRTKILLKQQGEAQIELETAGGGLGLVFDTRSVKLDFPLAYKQFNTNLKMAKGDIR